MKKYAESIHRIELPVPFPVKTINAYLIDEEPITLIDTGVKTNISLHVLEDSLRGLGYRIEDIKRVLITHGHLDHYGQAKKISALSGAEIFIHFKEYQRIRSIAQFRRRIASVLMQNGTPQECVEIITQYMESAQRWGETPEEVCFIKEGDKVLFKNMVLRPIHCPGHSPGLLCFYVDEKGILISGDHLLKEISSNPIIDPSQKGIGPQNTSLKQYLNSIRKIEPLGVFLVLPGHGEPIRNFKGLLAKILHHHEQRLSALLSILSRGERTAYDISRTLFPNTKSFEVFLGVSEVLGHLGILLDEQRVISRSRNGIDYYSTNNIPS